MLYSTRFTLTPQQIVGALGRDVPAVALAVPHGVMALAFAPSDVRQLQDDKSAEAAAGFQFGEASHSAACIKGAAIPQRRSAIWQ